MGALTRRINGILRRAGVELRPATIPQDEASLPLFDEPLDALSYEQGGKPASFHLPLDRTTHLVGWGFGTADWNPFIAAASEYALGLADSYEGSLLERYYATWQPANARHAYAGFQDAPERLAALPAWNVYSTPWSALSPDEAARWVKQWYETDYRPAGRRFQPALHGIKHFGPVDATMGRIEYDRLVSIFEALKRDGYDRSRGHVFVEVIRRGSDIRFLCAGGWHRKAAMAALGHATVPARFVRPVVFDVANVSHWPNVRRGLWTVDSALRLVDHLFDFDSREWAREKGILLEQIHPDVLMAT